MSLTVLRLFLKFPRKRAFPAQYTGLGIPNQQLSSELWDPVGQFGMESTQPCPPLNPMLLLYFNKMNWIEFIRLHNSPHIFKFSFTVALIICSPFQFHSEHQHRH